MPAGTGGPGFIPPMLATAAQSLPPDLDDWITEFKWDGMRCCLTVHRGRVRAWSRAGNDITSRFPELAAIGQLSGPSKILDGELVVIAGGRPDFGMLQRRMHVTRPGPSLLASAPVTHRNTAPRMARLATPLWIRNEPA